MSSEDKKKAEEHASRAARQMRHAAKNAGGAAEAAAEHMKDEIVDGAVDTKNRMKDLAAKAIGTEVGRGVLMLSLGVLAVGVGARNFRNAKQIRDGITLADHHIGPEA